MDIIYKGKIKKLFKCVVAGEVFKYKDCFFMRIGTMTSDIGIRYNVVNLDGGDLTSFDDNDAIEEVDAQLTIS